MSGPSETNKVYYKNLNDFVIETLQEVNYNIHKISSNLKISFYI